MSSKVVLAAGAMAALLAAAASPASMPRSGGTIAVMAPPDSTSDDPLTLVATDAATTALGMRGFTILNDTGHAAYIAEVIARQAEVGTSVGGARTDRAYMTGGGVNIPIPGRKSVLAPLQRTEVEIRIRERGGQAIVWHGAAVTVRSEAARNGGVDQVAFALSQAALSSYPVQTAAPISIP